MSSYDLDSEIQDDFQFILGGFKYKMRYPTTEEIAQSQKFEPDSPEQADWLYGFISSEDEKAPPVKDALNKMNVKKMQKFAQMIKTEFSSEE